MEMTCSEENGHGKRPVV